MRPLIALALLLCSASTRAEPPPGLSPGGLELSVAAPAAARAGDSVVVAFTLKNVGKRALKVYSYKHAGERHYPWFTVHLTRVDQAKADGAKVAPARRTIALFDVCTRCWPMTRTLRPGASLEHRVRLEEWARRSVNGRQALAPGRYTVEVVYEVQPERGLWSGTLRSAPVALTVAEPAARP